MAGSYWKGKATALLAGAGLALVLGTSAWAQEKTGDNMVVADGKQVSLEFTLSLDDKSQVQSNVGKEPLVFTQGSHQIIPGLEKHLTGLKAGDTKHVEVSPEEGYGPVDPSRTQEVEKDKIPEQARKQGAQLTGRGPQGQMMFAKVKEIKDKTVILDLNHPLAGQKLIFDVKVLKVENAPEPKPEAAAAAPGASTEKKLEMPPPAGTTPETKPGKK